MIISPDERALVVAVTELIDRRGAAHSHAAGVLSADGRTFFGVNLYHFSGGPCAEVVALGAMLTETDGPPVSVVAVARDGRGVVSPCGGCRQIMHDRWPGIAVILRRGDDFVRVTLPHLLPEP